MQIYFSWNKFKKKLDDGVPNLTLHDLRRTPKHSRTNWHPMQKLGVIDFFNEIEKAVRAKRDKPSQKTTVRHWGSVKEAIDQIKRRAIKRFNVE